MRKMAILLAGSFGLLGLVLYLQIISNSYHIAGVSAHLRQWASQVAVMDPQLSTRTLSKVKTYVEQIEEFHLHRGMVVNRNMLEQPLGTCDSLLFSSLYFVALKNMGYDTEAEKLWRNIEKSQNAGHWYRHPDCLKATSRDMIVGLLVALTQKPMHYRLHLKSFLHYVEANGGFVSKGPFYVSYLSPGIAEVARTFSRIEGYSYQEMPSTVRSGFSTLELDAMFARPGYTTHLHGLLVWLELELAKLETVRSAPELRTATRAMSSLTSPFTPAPLHKQRLEYITQSLVETDPENLFFKYLRIRVAGALNPGVRYRLLTKLNKMKQFPDYHLPYNCDRKADYLWQRASWEYHEKSSDCDERFSGVDYLWMTSLLLDDRNDAKKSVLDVAH